MTVDSALRDLIREVLRSELRPLSEDLRALVNAARARTVEASPWEILTVEEVSSALKVHKTTVRTWITSGALATIQPGGSGKRRQVHRIMRSDLEAFLANSRRRNESEVDLKAEAARIVERTMGRKRR